MFCSALLYCVWALFMGDGIDLGEVRACFRWAGVYVQRRRNGGRGIRGDNLHSGLEGR